jgi:hypothetical protein
LASWEEGELFSSFCSELGEELGVFFFDWPNLAGVKTIQPSLNIGSSGSGKIIGIPFATRGFTSRLRSRW